MKRTNCLLLLLSITASAACSDDAPAVDASVGCDCPAAEPPLDGRIITETGNGRVFVNSLSFMGESCDEGVLISGGCRLNVQAPEVVLSESGEGDVGEGWTCAWWNPTDTEYTGSVTIRCLVPAEE